MCIVGCDKTVPAALMALARIDKPAVVLYSGPMRAGRWRGRTVTIQDVWEAVGAYERGAITARSSTSSSAPRARARAPAPATSPPTRWRSRSSSSASRALGDGPSPPTTDAKDAAAARPGRSRWRLARGADRARLPRPPALLNAMAGIAATGGSTNGVLHLLAIAREADVAMTLDELAASPRARR